MRVFFEGYGSKKGRSELQVVNGGTFRGLAAQALAAEMRRVRRTPLCRVVLSGLCGASGRCSQKSGDAIWQSRGWERREFGRRLAVGGGGARKSR